MKSDHSHPVIDPHCSLCRIELDKVGVTAGGETLIRDKLLKDKGIDGAPAPDEDVEEMPEDEGEGEDDI